MTPEQRHMRAVSVRALLDDPNVREALSAVEADLIGQWRASQSPEERENCWRAVNIMDRLRTYLQSYASHDLTALRRANIR